MNVAQLQNEIITTGQWALQSLLSADMGNFLLLAHFARANAFVRVGLESSPNLIQDKKPSVFQSLALSFFSSTGGAWLNMILTGGLPFFLQSDLPIIFFFTTWFLTHYCPGDLFFRAMTSLPLNIIYCLVQPMIDIDTIPPTVDRVSKLFPDSLFGVILAGTFSGCGGTYLNSLGRALMGDESSSELRSPAFGATYQSVLSALLYLLPVFTYQLCTASEGRAILLVALIIVESFQLTRSLSSVSSSPASASPTKKSKSD